MRGCGPANCGHKGIVPGLSEEMQRRIQTHPCFCEEAHHHYARMHLAVAPACNIQCGYCNRRYDCVNESRPGVTSRVLTPEEALERVESVLARVPQLTVVGIAGPGDPMANPERTLRTFELISRAHPDLKLCLSTNGLVLADYADDLKRLGVDHVTVTVNMVDPMVGEQIYQWVAFQGRPLRGFRAAGLLADRQALGIRALAERDILCKVNAILIPGVNDWHIPEVVSRVKELGAFLVNVMPLIPVAGTRFEGVPAPTPGLLKAVQDAGQQHVRQMRHCRHCRADAVGLLGEDRSQEFHGAAGSEAPRADRAAVLKGIAETIEGHRRVQEKILATPDDGSNPRRSMLVAVATKGGGVVNLHFGHATEFLVYETGADFIKLVGVRSVAQYCSGPENCGEEDDLLEGAIASIADCQALLCTRIGSLPAQELARAGIATYLVYDVLEKALDAVARGRLQPLVAPEAAAALTPFQPAPVLAGMAAPPAAIVLGGNPG